MPSSWGFQKAKEDKERQLRTKKAEERRRREHKSQAPSKVEQERAQELRLSEFEAAYRRFTILHRIKDHFDVRSVLEEYGVVHFGYNWKWFGLRRERDYVVIGPEAVSNRQVSWFLKNGDFSRAGSMYSVVEVRLIFERAEPHHFEIYGLSSYGDYYECTIREVKPFLYALVDVLRQHRPHGEYKSLSNR